VLIISTQANCEVARTAMSQWVLEPICCASLQEARMVLVDAAPSLIFCDHQLPDGTYQDLLRMLDKMGKNRLVVITPTADDDKYEEAVALGAFDVIVSPCRRSDVQWIAIRAMQEDRREGRTPDSEPERLSSSGDEK
jgi:DNA-binding NtrC family response regulator